jgi:D-alanine--poly(phosphoribitol) ligase subunit 2
MPDRAAILVSLYRAIDVLNDQLPPEDAIVKSPTAFLYGGEGKLDSLGLVSLMFTVEQQIEADFGETISLSAETSLREVAQENDPFRRVDLLVDWLSDLLNDRKAAA